MKYTMSIEKSTLKTIIFDTLNTYTNLLNELGLSTEDLTDISLLSDNLMDLTKAMTNKLLDMSGIEGGIGVDDLTIEYAQTVDTVEIRVEASFKMVMAIINVYKGLINGNLKVLKNFMVENSELIGSLIKEMNESSQESIKKIATIITDAIDPEKFVNSSWGIFDENSKVFKRIQNELEPMVQEYIENLYADDEEEDGCDYCDGPCCSGCTKGSGCTESTGAVVINGGINFISATESAKVAETKMTREQELEEKYAKQQYTKSFDDARKSYEENTNMSIKGLARCSKMCKELLTKLDPNDAVYIVLEHAAKSADRAQEIAKEDPNYTMNPEFNACIFSMETYIDVAEKTLDM